MSTLYAIQYELHTAYIYYVVTIYPELLIILLVQAGRMI